MTLPKDVQEKELVIKLRQEAAIYTKRQGTHDNPDTTAHDFFEGAQFGYSLAEKEIERLKGLIEILVDGQSQASALG